MSTCYTSFYRPAVVAMIAALFTLVGCSSSTTTDPDLTPQDEGFMRATVNGQQWSCSPDAITAFQASAASTLMGSFESPTGEVVHSIIMGFPVANFKVGEYRIDTLGFDEDAGVVQYSEGGRLGFTAASQDDGFVRITSITATHIAGEFAFKLIGFNTETGEVLTRTFTGGTFRAPRLN